ncbi:MAG: hypothetical protein A2Y75_09880 [Candidatus Solincola sediminis]|uniref:Prepilin type IV endopeptidase peptidase domain-containing protein n=1 Tax=Candidatus Solincola sediminis TaxID=1797199 RepID=A0A1F2WF16_9ACTN|nr:MAG: hypothetical protein A2Y75_09880 [Candidatus Solincola sediminis]
MEISRLVLLFIFAICAAYYDFRYRLIPNWLVLLCLVSGMALVLLGGIGAFSKYGIGLALGFLLLLPAFVFNMVGGGDVKSLAMIGLLTGPRLLWASFLWGSLLTGAVALIMIASRWLISPCAANCDAEVVRAPASIPYAAILALTAAFYTFIG